MKREVTNIIVDKETSARLGEALLLFNKRTGLVEHKRTKSSFVKWKIDLFYKEEVELSKTTTKDHVEN